MKNEILINQIELYDAPYKEILKKMKNLQTEMSIFEASFLCGIIKKKRPRKILEVGVAAGGTTAIICQCVELLGIEDAEIYSVDYSEKLYNDKKHETGYISLEADKIINGKYKHKIYTGDIAVNFMDKIGGGVDLLILDTMHVLPGEILDMISLYPYLSKNAMVVMHDTIIAHYDIRRIGFATCSIFSNIVSKKYLNYDNERVKQIPNIAAIELTEETEDSLSNLVLSLYIPWNYVPYENQKKSYIDAITRPYPMYAKLIQDAFELNEVTYNKYAKYSFKQKLFRTAIVWLKGR